MKQQYAKVGNDFVKIDTVTDENLISQRIACLYFLRAGEDLDYMIQRFKENASDMRTSNEPHMALVFDALVNYCNVRKAG